MDGAHTHRAVRGGHERWCCRPCSRNSSQQRVLLEGMVLKPNMVISGKKAAHRAGPEVVAEATLRTLTRHVPPAVPGIAFLSGGQSPQEATLHLALMNKLGPQPWSLTFSYGRALQDTALKAWGGAAANFAAGQQRIRQAREAQRSCDTRPLHRRDGEARQPETRGAPAARGKSRPCTARQPPRLASWSTCATCITPSAAGRSSRALTSRSGAVASPRSWGRAAPARRRCCA